MSRNVSAAFKAAAFAQETGKVVAALLTVTHEDDPETYRFSSDPTQRLDGSGAAQPVYGTVSRGDEYLFLTPFQLLLPDDQDRSAPSARLRLSNIDRELITLLRSFTSPAQFLIELILADDPDTVEVTFPLLDLSAADYDAAEVELSVTVDALADEPYPADNYDPSGFPGLYAG